MHPPSFDVDDVLRDAADAFLGPALRDALAARAEPHPTVPRLGVAPGLLTAFPEIEGTGLEIAAEVWSAVRVHYASVLRQRKLDRAFLDAATRAMAPRNEGVDPRSEGWQTAIGLRDATGRLVIGPHPQPPDPPSVDVPDWLAGDQITLFGPPDSPRMAINAMNALARVRPDEPAIVTSLVAESGAVPRWGADSEDSKTPLRADLLAATVNLAACFDGTLRWTDPQSGRAYALTEGPRSLPIKRVAGLALPDGAHLLDGLPLPLHLTELVGHVWLTRGHPTASVLYLPKLENEEEAAYVCALLDAVEHAVARRHPSFAGPLRVLVVFENPRAIFRMREMACALGRHFLGGSLGWHDFLASTARLFRHDPGYRIPVKSDPDIVVQHICASHRALATQLGPSGALCIGGMYGVLPVEGDADSLRVSRIGFVRDVVTQLRRGLHGMWVAHPDFVRPGIALVRAWRRRERDPLDPALHDLVRAWVPDAEDCARLLAFVDGPDPGIGNLHGARSLLAADLGQSQVIANHDPQEVRTNVVQALHYLTDWLRGNGCVALPATLRDARGNAVPVRIMDDLATTERSRWELWHEVAHGRVGVDQFEAILAEEAARLAGAPWTAVAARVLRRLVVTTSPPEWVPELLLPFTFDFVRAAADPWAEAVRLCPGRLQDE